MATYPKPRTIKELRAFCAEKGMPLEKMRFFIGEDYREPRAFGIYRDENGEFVVYKNKDDGSRAIRYQGPDEAYAVNELYEKLRAEVSERQHASAPRVASPQKRGGLPSWIKLLIVMYAANFLIMGIAMLFDKTPKRGYYEYDDRDYYYYAGDWYAYDDDLLYWLLLDDVDPYLEDNASDYYLSDDYDARYGVSDFTESEYWYGEDYGYSSGSDDYDWGSGSDYDSWDSSGTDWSSDW